MHVGNKPPCRVAFARSIKGYRRSASKRLTPFQAIPSDDKMVHDVERTLQERVRAVDDNDIGADTASSSSNSDIEDELRKAGYSEAQIVMMGALSWESVAKLFDKNEIDKQYRHWRDKLYYNELLPPLGSLRMSYARMLELMNDRRIKRIIVMGNSKVAIVEVTNEGFGTDWEQIKVKRDDPGKLFAPENPEWQIEKIRYYVELPGDFWENEEFMTMYKKSIPPIMQDGSIPYRRMHQIEQVTPQLQIISQTDLSAFWNSNIPQLVPIVALLGLRVAVGVAAWVVKLLGKEKKTDMEKMAEEFGRARAKEFNVGRGKDRRDTGVRFADVAGIDAIKADIMRIMRMLVADDEGQKYLAMGARPPKGILLEGPPGTGKTYLAKAMAGEFGVPFFSANGAEFVEMFQGVASARIRNLFAAARKRAPAIVFIDEIDAIGKARGGGSDPGSAEREQGLLQLLVEMDGFKSDDSVLVVGATNRVDILDAALLRPGRFDHTIYMGRPGPTNRLKILQVHAGKFPCIPREGNEKHESDALLHDVAELTIGYSGAELANLLNEAAILSVRMKSAMVDMDIMRLAMEKIRVGVNQSKLPPSEAKRRFSLVQAARAVGFALTPGMPQLEYVSIQPQGGVMGRIVFMPVDMSQDGGQWHTLVYPQAKPVNAEEYDEYPGTFEFCAGLLVPLYVSRAAEEVFFGKRGVTLGTAADVSRAGDLAHWLVAQSTLHPAFRDLPLMYDMRMGGHDDPITKPFAAQKFEALTLQLQKAAYKQALKLVHERKPVIETVSSTMLNDSRYERMLGRDLVQCIKSTPLAPVPQEIAADASLFLDGLPTARGRLVDAEAAEQLPAEPIKVDDDKVLRAALVVAGKLDIFSIMGHDMVHAVAGDAQHALRDARNVERLQAVRRFATAAKAEFPPPPPQLNGNGARAASARESGEPSEPFVENLA